MLGVINATKSLVEEIIKTLVNVICLAHHNCVTFECRVTNGCNCVDLRDRNGQDTCVSKHVHTCVQEYVCMNMYQKHGE